MTVQTPNIPQARYVVLAEYYEGQPSLRAARKALTDYEVVREEPLIVQVAPGSFACLTKFGGAVYWNCDESAIGRIRRAISTIPGVGARIDSISDTLEVTAGSERNEVAFSEVRLAELKSEDLAVISLAMAKSVALEHFDLEVAKAMSRVQPVHRQLEAEGRMQLHQRDVLKAVGFALGVRAAVLQNLTLFEPPPETWSSEGAATLHDRLFANLDLFERLDAIEQKLRFLSDVNEMVMDLLNNRKAHRLEWIIIVLIAIEIIYFFQEEFTKLLMP
jgi:uncharacterized Rmd1/YagE family protein